MALRFPSAATFLAAIFLTTTAPAQTTWYVDLGNCPGPGSGTQGNAFCTIQTGIDAAGSGDTVLVSPGTYHETIDFIGKGVTLRSIAGPDATTIDASGLNDSVVKCVSGEGPDAVLQGFTITGGAGAIEGGGMSNIRSSPTMWKCSYAGRTAVKEG